MATQVQLRRGDNTAHSSFTGVVGEVTVNTTNDSIHVHDGSTSGGFELLRADLNNITGDTDDITEGSSNLYYTNSRVDAEIDSYLSGGTGITVSSGAIAIDFTEFSTTNITEGTNLYYTDARADARITASGVISDVVDDTTPQLGGDLETNSNDIKFADNDKALFGADGDLKIYHDGSDSIIEDTGTGDLIIKASQRIYMKGVNDETLIRSTENSQISLYHNNAEKLSTLSGGVQIYGALTLTGTVDGRDIATDGTKLDGIETGADVTDTTNVVAALTAGTNVTIGADGTISSTDTNTTYSVGDGGLTEKNFTTALNTKLSGIETGATADQTASEILTAIKTVDGAASGLDADLLDGQQGSYYAALASPSLTGTPTAPTASTGTNTTQLATTAFVQQEITALKALLYAYDQS